MSNIVVFRGKKYAEQIAQNIIDKESRDLFDFIDGQEACKQGQPHTGGTASFARGYAAQYQLEQIQNERTRGHE